MRTLSSLAGIENNDEKQPGLMIGQLDVATRAITIALTGLLAIGSTATFTPSNALFQLGDRQRYQ
jgi:hypothetical protein